MYLDAKLLFSDSQTVAAGPSTNVIDLKDARDIGVGENLYVMVVVESAITGTLAIALESDDNDAFSSAKSTSIGAFAASAPAGSKLVYRISPGAAAEQYARLAYTGGSAGTISAFIVKDVDLFTSYPDAITIS